MDERNAWDRIRRYYDEIYHRDLAQLPLVSRHDERLALRLGIGPGTKVLDVACGRGGWLAAAARRGASVSGVDISGRAVAACRELMPGEEFQVSPAEDLPFAGSTFELVTCFGALEHFLDPARALSEMVRVAGPDARFLLLVPNADFLTRRLGLFGGTRQKEVREDVRTIEGWEALFASSGMRVVDRWRDLHVLSRRWICRGSVLTWPVRLAQALALAVWPLRWQYQVYFLCGRAARPAE